MRTSLMILSMGFGYYNCNSQNLIVNGSFENHSNPVDCNGGGFFNVSTFPAVQVVDNWNTLNSPDYFNSVCGSGGYSVPNSIFGYCNAKHGIAYGGLATFPPTGDNSEYIYQQLSTPLQTGTVYCLSFYVSRADRKEYALKNIGAYFSVSTPTMVSNTYINSIPQVINQNVFITDTTNWTKIQGCYTAIGGEQYVTFGNFNSGGNSDTLQAGTTNPIASDPKYAYYYIDSITLYDQTTVGIKDLSEVPNIKNIYPNPASDVLNIELGSLKPKTEIKIYNAFGELFLIETLTDYKTSLKTHHLKSGIYFYHILVGGKSIKNDKIIIIK